MSIDIGALYLAKRTPAPRTLWAQVDERGRLVLPPEVAAEFRPRRRRSARGWT